MSNFGDWLNNYMASQRPPIERVELARRSGVSAATIGRWIRGEIEPKPDNLRRVAPVLGVAYSDLMALAGYGAPTEPDPELLVKRPMHRLSVELDRMLDPDSPLVDIAVPGGGGNRRDRLEMIVDQFIEVERGYMKRRRTA